MQPVDLRTMNQLKPFCIYVPNKVDRELKKKKKGAVRNVAQCRFCKVRVEAHQMCPALKRFYIMRYIYGMSV
jgi:hypothetical protein